VKVLAATLLAMVFVVSGSAMAGKSPSKSSTSEKKACSESQKKAGKCNAESDKVNVPRTVAAPSSVRSGSMENPSSRAPASVMDNNTH